MRSLRYALFLSVLLIVPFTAHASPSDLANMVQAEYDFAAMAKREGYKASFLKYLAKDAVMFINGPVEGHKRVSERPDLPGLLQWYPSYAVVASTGDVGLSTGPWVYTNAGNPSAYGHFLSIWRRQSDGTWINVLDVGIDHPELKPAPEKLQVSGATSRAPAAIQHASDHAQPARNADAAIREAESQFAQVAAKSGYATAAERVAHAEMRVYRDGHAPVSGASPATSFLKQQAAVGEPKLEYASGSGDFGYAYGMIAKKQGDGTSHWFVHVWKQEGNKWQLLADLLTPVSEPKAQ